jgi:hypothetical protein
VLGPVVDKTNVRSWLGKIQKLIDFHPLSLVIVADRLPNQDIAPRK